jgi:hypothetical protein
MKFRSLLFTVVLTACATDESSSIEAASQQGHQRPPAEALDACDGSTAGAACAFDIDDHHITGTCRQGPNGDGPLACAPDHPPPPPEALAACTSATAGATCAFDIDGHHVEGTCRQGPNGDGPLACAPANPPPQP